MLGAVRGVREDGVVKGGSLVEGCKGCVQEKAGRERQKPC